MHEQKNQAADSISTFGKLKRLTFLVVLLTYFGHGAWNNDLVIWYSSRARGFLHIHGFALWTMCAAITVICAEVIYSLNINSRTKKLSQYSGEVFLLFLITSIYSTIFMAIYST